MRRHNTLNVFEAGPEHAADVLSVIRHSFSARPTLDPPSTALDETIESVAETLAGPGGLLAERRGVPMGAILFDESRPGALGLRRVSVDPRLQKRGVASALVGVAEDVAEERGCDSVWLKARVELPDTVSFWERREYIVVGTAGPFLEFGKTLWLARELPDAEATKEFAARLADLLRAGDLLVLDGELGAGKTTFTQGLAAALGVRGPITSPTFVIARTHPSLVKGPGLVHVDAYRLGGSPELEDLDLDASLEDSVTVVEWGEGIAEALSQNWLSIRLERRRASPDDPVGAVDPEAGTETRVATVRAHGARWVGVPLRSHLLGAAAGTGQ